MSWATEFLHGLAAAAYAHLKGTRLGSILFPGTISRDVEVLGKSQETYYRQKIFYALAVLIGVLVLLCVYGVQQFLQTRAVIQSIDRPETFEENNEVKLRIENNEEIYTMEVAPRTLSKEEAGEQAESLFEQLPSFILGENASLEEVTENLYLPEIIEGYPFEIYWESREEARIDTQGTVNREGLKEDRIVILTAILYYRDWWWQQQFPVLLKQESLSPAQQYQRSLEEFLTASEASGRGTGTWVLPQSFQGEELEYHLVKREDTFLILAGLMAIMGIALWLGQDYDLRNIRKKRQEHFKQEYAGFLSSLSMYLSAGLTIQGAMDMCGRDYARRKPLGHLLRDALSEYQKDMLNGHSVMLFLQE